MYVVRETLAGKQERLKAYQIAVEAYNRNGDFDSQDPYVRNAAKDVRRALSAFYDSRSPSDIAVKISIPTGKYIPCFALTPKPDGTATTSAQIQSTEILDEYGSLNPTIAVFPLRALSCAESQQLFGEAFADDLINSISRHEDFNIISRLSTSSLALTDLNFAKIKDKLNANYIVSGTFSIEGDIAKINIELAEVASELIVFSEQVHLSVRNLLNLGDEFTAKIVKNFSASIANNEVQYAMRKNPLDLKNYTLLISAINLLHRVGKTEFLKARELLDVLVDRNTKSPFPYAWYAKWHVLNHVQGMSADVSSLKENATNCTNKALDMDSTCSLALTMDGLVHTNILRKLDIAKQRYDAALQYNPNDSLARLLRGTLHAFRGEGEEAMTDVVQAQNLSPLDPMRYYYLSLSSTAALSANNYDIALSYATDSLKLNPNHTSTLRAAAIANVNLDNQKAAQSNIKSLLKLDPSFTINRFLKESPSADYKVGRHWAESLRTAGVP